MKLRTAMIIGALLLCLSVNAGIQPVSPRLRLSFESPRIGLIPADSTARTPGGSPSAGQPFAFSLASGADREDSKAASGGPKNLGRAVLEFGVIMAISQTNYWVHYDRWREDWEYRATWADQKRRFFSFEAWKFDTNRYGTNWMHSLSGAINYNIARSNGLDIIESMLFGVMTSLYWEYIVEYKEALSINDSLLNPLSGMYIGEAWYQVGRFFATRKDSAARFLSMINPIVRLNHRLDGGRGRGGMNPGDGGHDIHLDVGYSTFRAEKTSYPSGLLHLGFRAALMNGPARGGESSAGAGTGPPAATELRTDVSIKGGKIEELALFSRVVWTALMRRDDAPPAPGNSSWSLGLASGFSVLNKRGVADYDLGKVDYGDQDALRLDEPRDFRDKFCITHIIGPAFDAAVISGDLKLRLKWDAYIDFCLMNAFALNAYSRVFPINGFKPTLLYYGYYYGRGFSTLAGFSADWRALRLSGGAAYHAADSIKGRERFQGAFEKDVAVNDSRVRLEFGLGIRLPGIPARIALTWEGVGRKGTISSITESEFEDKIFADLQVM
ncbi:MAG TPA: DUF3943 domain-containing protein, partial [Candidatus Aminicenantes bacterium]|nr:DUF3943 domain-containing protein [Candidatus Aminicenantes bacterium]